MNFLLKQHQYSKTMDHVQVDAGWWDNLISNPPVMRNKDRCPLAIFGKPVSDPELDYETCKMRCIGANVDSLFALSLDYDNGNTIEQFIEEYKDRRFSLYTSYSYGVKEGDRFRVVIPLAKPFPCDLLESKRVRDNLVFQYHGIDVSAVTSGHWQILPVKNPAGKYFFYKNGGDMWEPTIEIYRAWKLQEDMEREQHMKELAERKDDRTQERIKNWLVSQLDELECGCGTRYNKVKSLLAWAMHNGLGDAVLSIECPWLDDKWQRRWKNLIEWASTLQ